MQEIVESIKKLLILDLREKDEAGIYIPRAIDEGIKQKALQELLRKIEREKKC